MKKIEKEIRTFLVNNTNEKNIIFQSKLIPTIDKRTILGIKTPFLREYARQLYKTADYKEFLKSLPHKYFDENNLHAFIIENIKDYDKCIKEINKFLPYIDNWATCDSLCPKVVKKHTSDFLKYIKKWIQSKKTYVVRFGIKMLMSFYLDEKFKPEYLKLVLDINFKSRNKYNNISILECPDKYYVEMMRAWYFATAIAKQVNDALPYIKNKKFDAWTHNMIIKKSCESYRVSEKIKRDIKKLKI